MKNRSHRLIKYVLLFFTTLAILYSFFWFKAANNLEKKIIQEIDNLNNRGYNIRYNAIYASGFPFKLKINFDDFLGQLPPPLKLSIILMGPLIAHAPVTNPNNFYLEIAQPFYICANDQIDSQLALLNVGTLKLKIPHTKQNNFELFLTDITHHSHEVATILIAGKVIDEAKELYHIAIDYKNLTIKNKALENLLNISCIQRLNFALSLQYPYKQAKNLSDLKSLIQTLYNNESAINLDYLNIVCKEFSFESNGSIAFDESLQPIIVLSTEITGIDHFLKLMAHRKLIHKSLLPLISSGLHSMAESGRNNNQEKVHKVSITLQNQELTILNFLVAKFPNIQWQDL